MAVLISDTRTKTSAAINLVDTKGLNGPEKIAII